jgi:hypothetical protein
MDTERLHDRIGDAEAKLKIIDRDCADLQRAVDALLSDFAMKHPTADIIGMSKDFGLSLSCVQDELSEPFKASKDEAEDELDNIEWRDMERNRVGAL